MFFTEGSPRLESLTTTTWLAVGIRAKLGNSTFYVLFCLKERLENLVWARLPDLKSVTRFRLRLSLFLRPFFVKSSKRRDFYFSLFEFSCSTVIFAV